MHLYSYIPHRIAAICIAANLGLLPVFAAVPYSAVGSSYEQNFNSLLSTNNSNAETELWENDSTLPGWYYALTDGSEPEFYIMNDGNPTSGVTYQNRALSLGPNGGTDRALGSQSSNTDDTTMRYALELTNTTGQTLTEFTLSYTGEQWRRIGGEENDLLTFDYQVFGSGTGNNIEAASGWTAETDLNFIAPVTAHNSGSLDGNEAANREMMSATITGINWTAGSALWLRWSDQSSTPEGDNLRAAIGIDDVSFTAIPEPSTYILVLGAICMLFVMTRRFRLIS